jgi:transcriptional regulator with XRE-family HTH domain
MTVNGPTVVRRQLGNRLRKLREDAGQTISAVAGSKVFSTSKMIRMEGGKIEVKAGDVWTLCRFYKVTDSAVIDALAALADGTGERGWWEAYNDRIPDWFALYLGLEEGADELMIWQPELVPGLLQTPDYSKQVLRAVGIDDVARSLELRRARQERFFTRTDPGPLRVVLGPDTQLRDVGENVQPAQQAHLIALNARPGVELRVLPFSVGAHVGMAGGFTIFDFASAANPSAVYLETLIGGHYLEHENELAQYRQAFDTIWQQSVPIEEHSS